LTRCPRCGVVIGHLDYWERAINMGEYWRDGFRDVAPSHADEYYFLIEAAEKFLKDQPITEDDICPEDY